MTRKPTEDLIKFLITTFASGEHYVQYIPLYIYSIKKAYPEYAVRVFTDEPLPAPIMGALDLLDAKDCIVVKDFGFPKNSRAFQTTRFLLDSSDIGDYDYVYIGDVDFVILREFKSILSYNLAHCLETKLPYSNMIRPGTTRMTGLHFIVTRRYFPLMDPVIARYRQLLRNQDIPIRDEELLYNMVKEAGMKVLHDDPWTRRYHGVHLTHARRQKKENLQLKNDQYSVYKRDFLKWFVENKEELDRLLVFTPEIAKEVTYMYEVINESHYNLHGKL